MRNKFVYLFHMFCIEDFFKYFMRKLKILFKPFLFLKILYPKSFLTSKEIFKVLCSPFSLQSWKLYFNCLLFSLNLKHILGAEVVFWYIFYTGMQKLSTSSISLLCLIFLKVNSYLTTSVAEPEPEPEPFISSRLRNLKAALDPDTAVP